MGIYSSIATGVHGDVELCVKMNGVNPITVTPPPEFKGPEGFWTPEDLFSASISSCYILTFRAIARASELDWIDIEVNVDATLGRVDKSLKFTTVDIRPFLTITCNEDIDDALRLLEKAKTACLITRSMNCEFILKPKIKVRSTKLSSAERSCNIK